jgi:hypothetical protein
VGVLGALFERVFLRRVHKFGHVPELLITFGMSYVIIELVQLVWGRITLEFKPPESLQGPVFTLVNDGVKGISLLWGAAPADVCSAADAAVRVVCSPFPATRGFMMLVALVMLGAVWLLLTRTRIGLVIQASLTHPEAVQSLGHNVPRVFMLVFGAGSALAGLAGVIAQALAAGVDKSNMAEAIQDIASQQSQYASTGLAADPGSYFAGAGALNRLGISDPRARGITGQMRDKGRGIATGGLSNSTDYAMLTTLGGFRPGGSEDELGAALERMETGGDLSKIPDLLRMASDASGGGLAGRIAASQVGGVPLSEARRILAGEVDPAAAAAQDAARKSGMTVDQLGGAASRQVDTYGSGARTSAALSNERAATGANFIQTAANLERAQLASTRSIGAFNTQLDSLTTAVLTVSRAIERAANGLAEVGRTR